MREILFRAKRVDNGEWIYGYPFIQGEGTEYEEAFILGGLDYRESIYDVWKCAEVVDPKTICQFTSLLDKNGNKIFEGDICDMSILGGDHTLVKIIIQHGCVGYEPIDYNSVHPDDRKWRSFWGNEENYMWDTSYFAVIGNICDNPELFVLRELECEVTK
jgi:uncharacterized phage protein (TIGR01671 family)